MRSKKKRKKKMFLFVFVADICSPEESFKAVTDFVVRL